MGSGCGAFPLGCGWVKGWGELGGGVVEGRAWRWAVETR